MLKALLGIYTPNFANSLVYMFQSSDYKAGAYLKKFWQTQNFAKIERGSNYTPTRAGNALAIILKIGFAVEILVGLLFLYLWHWHNLAGGLAFGVALIVAYPVIWAHLLPAIYKIYPNFWWLNPKKAGKAVLCKVLESQVVSLRAKHKFKLIAVVGSMGKTSTKMAVAQVLANKSRVLYQEGNYNDRLVVPLVIFGRELPGLFNILAWTKLILKNEKTIKSKFDYDYVVVELGTDAPGQLKVFEYLKPDISVVTGVAPEHMEFFGSLAAVAREELIVFDYSSEVLVNVDDTPAEYLEGKTFKGYGFSPSADFKISDWRAKRLKGSTAVFKLGAKNLDVKLNIVGKQGAKILLAAAGVAHELGFKPEDIKAGLENIQPFAGRLQILDGIKGSIIIDDSYNASPAAVKAGLDVLYAADAAQRIAILGSMNELGEYSKQAHQEVGAYCDKEKLDLVVTIGADAKKYLAPVAVKAGCKVETFKSPYDAGEFVKSKLKSGAVTLVKGSQNGVFAEESIKALLASPEDESRLVRQSKAWMETKSRQFKP